MNDTYRVPTAYLWLAVIILAVLLLACGGGGVSLAGVGSGGTGAAFSGSISGFGSIIVNGVRIDDSAATITLDDDKTDGRNADLGLGMMVEVEGDRDADGTTARANSIFSRSFVQGPISAINAGAHQLTVLGLTVAVTSATVYHDAGGLSSLAVNESVEVHGIPNGPAGLTATRVERKAATNEIRLTGTVQAVDASTLTVNGNTIQYQPADLVGLPNGISAGMLVRVKGTLSGTTIDATSVRQVRLAPAVSEGKHLEVDGYVSGFTSTTNFEMNGLPVNVPLGATVIGTVARGARVEVEGRVANNVLVADKVEVKDETLPVAAAIYEVHDTISNLNLLAHTFTMRSGDVTVKWDSSTVFASLLGAASLVNGLKVEVKGRMEGNVLLAASIKPES